MITEKLGTAFAVLCNRTVNNILCAFFVPQAQGFEKQASMIALSVVVLFFLYTADILTNAETETKLSHPALMLLVLIV